MCGCSVHDGSRKPAQRLELFSAGNEPREKRWKKAAGGGLDPGLGSGSIANCLDGRQAHTRLARLETLLVLPLLCAQHFPLLHLASSSSPSFAPLPASLLPLLAPLCAPSNFAALLALSSPLVPSHLPDFCRRDPPPATPPTSTPLPPALHTTNPPSTCQISCFWHLCILLDHPVHFFRARCAYWPLYTGDPPVLAPHPAFCPSVARPHPRLCLQYRLHHRYLESKPHIHHVDVMRQRQRPR